MFCMGITNRMVPVIAGLIRNPLLHCTRHCGLEPQSLVVSGNSDFRRNDARYGINTHTKRYRDISLYVLCRMDRAK
jgi:hypothetical protein